MMGEWREVISVIPGWSVEHFKFQIREEGRPGGPAKIKGILPPVQIQTRAAQKQLNGSGNDECKPLDKQENEIFSQ